MLVIQGFVKLAFNQIWKCSWPLTSI